MEDLPTIQNLFKNLQTWAHEHAPEVIFNPPVKSIEIDQFLEKSGLMLPDSFNQLLLYANGEAPISAGMIGNWRLMPIREIQAAWGWLTALSSKGAFEDYQPLPSPYLRRDWWNPAWVPIVSSDTGNYFCLDTAPIEPQRVGQILLFLQDQPERYLVAASLSAWFDQILRDLQSGRYVYDDEFGFNGEAFMWSALEGKHHFDNRPRKTIAQREIGDENAS